MKPIGFYNYTVIATYLGLASAGMGCFFAAEGMPKEALFCLMIAGAFDMVDGKIASTRKRTVEEKQFGIQIDSLCDLVSFGVLPALLLHCFPLPKAAKGIAGVLFILAAIIRLAYFNVTEETRQSKTTGKRKFYEGLPVTSTALLLPLLYIFRRLIPDEVFGWCYLGLLALIGILFLSPFKLKKPAGTTMIVMAAIGVCEIVGMIVFA